MNESNKVGTLKDGENEAKNERAMCSSEGLATLERISARAGCVLAEGKWMEYRKCKEFESDGSRCWFPRLDVSADGSTLDKKLP